MASSGFQGDLKALQKNLAARHLVKERFFITSFHLIVRSCVCPCSFGAIFLIYVLIVFWCSCLSIRKPPSTMTCVISDL